MTHTQPLPTHRPPIRVEDIPWEEFQEGSRFGSRFRRLGAAAGGSKVGVTIEELPPGRESCPPHYHLLEEEHILVLAGTAILKLGGAEYDLIAGSYVCFPAGQPAAHSLVNRSAETFRYLILGTSDPHDVTIYPESGRVGVRLTGEGYDGTPKPYWEDMRR